MCPVGARPPPLRLVRPLRRVLCAPAPPPNSRFRVSRPQALVLSLQRIETWGGVAWRRSLLPPSDLRSGRPLLLLPPPRDWRPAVPPSLLSLRACRSGRHAPTLPPVTRRCLRFCACPIPPCPVFPRAAFTFAAPARPPGRSPSYCAGVGGPAFWWWWCAGPRPAPPPHRYACRPWAGHQAPLASLPALCARPLPEPALCRPGGIACFHTVQS